VTARTGVPDFGLRKSYFLLSIGIVATQSIGRFQGGSRRPDEEPLVFC